MRTVHVETMLPTSAERVWSAMLSPATFLYVCKGLFGFPALAGRTEALRLGESGTGWLFAFHVIPAYRHTINVVEVDEAAGTIRTRSMAGRSERGTTPCTLNRSTRSPAATATPSTSTRES